MHEPQIHHRYMLQDLIGQGAMGSVFQAYDRLTQQTVALKRLDVKPKDLDLPTASSKEKVKNLRLLLANEFQHLATLRHPHIIKVLDYGFDHQRHPFFTMTFLEHAVTLLEAGGSKSQEEKIHLLIQVLEAMSYLHQRGVLHRDLKPANILIQNGHAYLLDFGLAVALEKAEGRAGTLVYMAPEVLLKAVALPSSDLYSFGIIAYRLFTGQLPYEIENLMDIVEKSPDMSPFAEQPRLGAWLEKLLKKDPEARYQTPREVLAGLYEVLEKPMPQEPLAFQESFLQAARLIGRREELHHLTEALRHALKGHGSGWLIGGESGVGKSRLLEEIRTRALVGGAMVLRGQAVEGGGRPYQLWREAARQLALSTALTPLESGVLREIVPDLETLLNHEIPEPPPLDPRFKHQRLIYIFAQVVKKTAQQRPIVFVLEDLQWSKENLDFLHPLIRICGDTRVLILGSFRLEDQPDLPQTMPGMNYFLLKRLNASEVTELAVSMLGKTGKQAQVLTLLQKETEGNTYFLIETIRALAENAGGVEAIGVATLPNSVFAGGVQTILHRRLQRVPQKYVPLLKFAALAGRQLDLRLLQAYTPNLPLETWLAHCTGIAVLEVYEDNWRFTHDKLRETLMLHLPKQERKILHGEVAHTIEQVYAEDLAPYYSILAAHYHQAGNRTCERHYVSLAAKQAIAQYANAEALQFLTRELELIPESQIKERFDLLLERAKIHELTSNQESLAADLDVLEGLAQQLGLEEQVRFMLQQFPFKWFHQDVEAATAIADRAYELARQLPGSTGNKLAYQARIAWARTAYANGTQERIPTAMTYLKETFSQASETHDLEAMASASGLLGHLLWLSNQSVEAQPYLEQSLVLNRQTGNRRTEASILNGLGNIFVGQDENERAISYFQAALAVEREIGYRLGEAIELFNLSYLKLASQHYRDALEYVLHALQANQEIGLDHMVVNCLNRLAMIYDRLGDSTKAQDYLQKGRAVDEQQGSKDIFGISLQAQFTAAENVQAAQELFKQAVSLSKELEPSGIPLRALEAGNTFLRIKQFSLAEEWFKPEFEGESGVPTAGVELKAGLAAVAFARGNLAKALPYVNELLIYQSNHPDLAGFFYPEMTFLTCYQVLHATGDARTIELLSYAYSWLEKVTQQLPEGFDLNLFWQARPERHILRGLYQSNR